MTPTQPERLDRIEALLEATTQIAQSNAKAIEAAASDRAQLRTAIDELARVAGQTLRHMQEMQSEIRGLQLENHKMLDYLFGQGDGESGDQ